MSKKRTVTGVFSRTNESILTILKKEGYISDFKLENQNNKRFFTIDLRYHDDNQPALTDVKLYSTPGKRDYRRLSQVGIVLGGLGLAFYSTPKGVMTDIEARQQKTGGELLFEIW